jgi:putative transposase
MREPSTYFRRNLPHYHPNDRPYFLTFRLAGSLPADNLRLSELLRKRNFLQYDEKLDRMTSGPHHLRDSRIANLVKESIQHRDGKEYMLHAYTLMSNHVHMVIELPEEAVLSDIMQSLKSYTGRNANKLLKQSGDFWLHEGYDRVIRKGRFGHAVAYTLNNPVKAGIVDHWKKHPWTYLSPELPGFD